MSPCPPTTRTNRRHGFTLIELMVVISIISLTIAILLPALTRARESMRRVNCLSQLRQIHLAGYLYGQDNQNAWTYSLWHGSAQIAAGIPAYLGLGQQSIRRTILTCDSAQNLAPTLGWDFQVTYTMNWKTTHDRKRTWSAQDWDDSLRPAEQGYVFDGACTLIDEPRQYFYEYIIRRKPFTSASTFMPLPHENANNTAFVDGHATLVQPEQWNAWESTSGHIFWHGR